MQVDGLSTRAHASAGRAAQADQCRTFGFVNVSAHHVGSFSESTAKKGSRTVLQARKATLVALLFLLATVGTATSIPGVGAAASAATQSGFTSAQVRVGDSRYANGGLPAQLVPDTEYSVPVAAKLGVSPGSIAAVSVNLTSYKPLRGGWVSINPTAGTSALLFNTGETVSGTAIAPLDSNGNIHLSASAETGLIVDVQGYFSSDAGQLRGIPSQRLADSRTNYYSAGPTVAPGTVVSVPVRGRFNIPTTASAIFASITVISPTANGYLEVAPASGAAGATSLNFVASDNQGLSAMLPIQTDGTVKFTVRGATTSFALDVQAYSPASPTLGRSFSVDDFRVYDSRYDAATSPLSPNAERSISLAGMDLVPDDATNDIDALAFTITVVNTANGSGYVKAWGSDAPESAASNLNYTAGDRYESAGAVVKPNSDGTITFKNYGSSPVELVIDVQGWFGAKRTVATESDVLAALPPDGYYAKVTPDDGSSPSFLVIQSGSAAPQASMRLATNVAWVPASGDTSVAPDPTEPAPVEDQFDTFDPADFVDDPSAATAAAAEPPVINYSTVQPAARGWSTCWPWDGKTKVVKQYKRQAVAGYSGARATLACGTNKNWGYRHIDAKHGDDWQRVAIKMFVPWQQFADWAFIQVLSHPSQKWHQASNDTLQYRTPVDIVGKRGSFRTYIIVMSVATKTQNIITSFPTSK